MSAPVGGRALAARSHPALLCLALLFLPAMGWVPASAGEPNRAGFAVLFEDGTLVTRCVEFEADTISGSEMLARSGLDVIVDATHGGGITVCQVSGTGCGYPVEACFCQCMGGGPCRYWNYFYREPGQEEWVYSTLGALAHESAPGSVEAWVWGDGHTPPGRELTFESVCAPSPSPSPPPTLAPAPKWTASPPSSREDAPSPTPGATAGSIAPTATPPPAEATGVPPSTTGGMEKGEGAWRSYWPFGLMLLLLAAAAAYLRAGRRA